MKIPVIDLFAGPGGLGEGFSSLLDEKGKRVFDIKLSIEKDEHAHQTLRLRSFFRQFNPGQVPELYYDYVKENDKAKQNKLLDKLKVDFSEEWGKAEEESWLCELGNENYPSDIVDDRIKHALGHNKSWLLIGGPPCQAYSLVGRSRNNGLKEEDKRVFLYREYLRIIARHHPKVFVMENVKGLLSAKLDGNKIFDWIKADLKDPGRLFPGNKSPKYKIYSFVTPATGSDENNNPIYERDSDFLIRTENYGVPQKRHRVILLGIRDDLKADFTPLEQKPQVKLVQILESLPKIRSGIGREISGKNIKGNHTYLKIENTRANWNNAVNESVNKLKKEFKNNDLLKLERFPDKQGANFVKSKLKEDNNPLYKMWYKDKRLDGVLNHESRSHLKEDLCRYLFSALFLKDKGDFPKLRDYPNWLLPEHKNAKGGKFADRFRTQRPDQPATTVTSHISKDGHYFIHYDPSQCRSLTVREAARIQTFPDNYYFCGTRTQQYHQVGNAVPPYLAKQLAEIVKKLFTSNN